MYCGNDMSIVISARYGFCNSFFTKYFFWSSSLLLASLRRTNSCIDHDLLCTSQGPLKNKLEKFAF